MTLYRVVRQAINRRFFRAVFASEEAPFARLQPGLADEVSNLLGQADGLLGGFEVRFGVGFGWVAAGRDVGVQGFGDCSEVGEGRVQAGA